jgi:hypothetical protein
MLALSAITQLGYACDRLFSQQESKALITHVIGLKHLPFIMSARGVPSAGKQPRLLDPIEILSLDSA